MSVLDQRYRRWEGQPTPYWQRVLVIPRYDILEIMSKKAWAAFYIISLFPPLFLGLYIYVVANLSTLAKLVQRLPGFLIAVTPDYVEDRGTQIWRERLRIDEKLLETFSCAVDHAGIGEVPK